jgi:hypothetical protein
MSKYSGSEQARPIRRENFAIERDWLDSNLCQMIKRPAPDRQRQRVPSEEEVRAVWPFFAFGC